MSWVARFLTAAIVMVWGLIPSAHAMEIVYPQSDSGDSRLSYPVALLELALTKAGVDYTLVPKERPESNKRLAALMEQEGTFDVAFFGTRPELEDRLRPIRFPIHRGLLGYRVAITARDNLERLDEIDTVDDFLSLRICQGLGWSDTEILESAGFQVETGKYQNLFRVVNAGRCDIYTRAVFEAYNEVAERQDTLTNLVVDDSILIRYRLASFIFVNPAREDLALAIETGLAIAQEDGSFRALFEAAEVHAEARERTNIAARHCLDVANPLLSPETAAIPDEYWGGFSFEEGLDQGNDCVVVGSVAPAG